MDFFIWEIDAIIVVVNEDLSFYLHRENLINP
jgi:hypothetical protein